MTIEDIEPLRSRFSVDEKAVRDTLCEGTCQKGCGTCSTHKEGDSNYLTD